MFEKIISKVRTTEERDKILAEVSILLNSFYQDKGLGFSMTLKSQVRNWISQVILDEIPEDKEGIEKYLNDLKTKLDSLQTLTITVAFEPTSSSLDKFVGFVRENVSEDIILQIESDPSILGGAIITKGGQYRDFSLRRLFDSEFEAKKDELIKEIYKR
jgi:F0F1-type ATP synthase delta subunit